MTKNRTRVLLFLLVSLSAISMVVAADGGAAPLGIVPGPLPTPTPLSVNIWTQKTSYMIGENVTIYFSVSQPAYVYIYDIQPDGVVRLIFPNAYSQANYVSPGTRSLPDGLYRFTVTPPAGTEQLQIFASPIQLALAPSGYSEPFPLAGNTPQSAGAHIMGIMPSDPQPQWATAWTSFTIVGSYGYSAPPTSPYPYPSPTPPPGYSYYPPMYPPFTGYPGGTWYWHDGAWHFGMPTSGWYWYFGPDGAWHIRIVIRFGIGG